MMQNVTNIRHLNLKNTSMLCNGHLFLDCTCTGHLGRIFSNVRELRIDGNICMTVQKWPRPFSYGDWSQLDYVEGSVSTLYRLSLISRIRKLRVPSPREPKHTVIGRTSHTDAFLDLVRTANPEALSFGIDLQSKLADVTFFRELAQALLMLKFLAVSVTSSTAVIQDLIIALKPLQNVPLIFLAVRIRGRSFEKKEPLSDEHWQTALQPIASSIEYIEFKNTGTYWTVKMDGNYAICTKFPELKVNRRRRDGRYELLVLSKSIVPRRKRLEGSGRTSDV
ncbi:hypothetical protein PILCRDRAFT_83451 [Piloderma croceum F 1598]|uniref:Uncharacterized protein n=1 Tax=Piloderma croceum (strain F 1598) TaxID=765440 RepID=A0A0C3CRB0_PILCF|nr:hypothetical protein PILCRDRAFT_83451 [Piloderma croceum F 1598]